MDSILHYIEFQNGSIGPNCDETIDPLWNTNPTEAYTCLDMESKWKFILGQCCALSYCISIAGLSVHPYITDYKENLIGLINELKQKLPSSPAEDYRAIGDLCLSLLEHNVYGYGSSKIDISLVTETLFSSDSEKAKYPIAVVPNFIIPFLHFRNATCGSWYNENREIFEQDHWSYGSSAIMALCVIENDALLLYGCHTKNHTDPLFFKIDNNIYMRGRNHSSLVYLSCFMYEGIDLDEVLGILSHLTNINDPTIANKNLNTRLSYSLRSVLYTYDCYNPLVELLPYHDTISDVDAVELRQFIIALRKRDNIIIRNRNTLARLFSRYSRDDKEARNLSEYFSAAEVTAVSCEAFKAFFSSEFGKISELSIEFKDASGDAAEDQNAKDPKPEDDNEPATQKKSSEQAESTDDAPQDPEKTEEEAASDNDSAQDETPSGEDDTSEIDQEDPTDDQNNNTNVTQQHGPPQDPTNDKRGVEIAFVSLSEETDDTILAKLEMARFLDEIIANPPRTVSPQQVKLLLMVRKLLLFRLHISSLRDIVANAIKLPTTFKNHMENKNE